MARIGTVGYLNARPLSDCVDIDRHTLVLAHPAEVARMLRDREVDVALIPVGAALADPGYRVVPGWCIGADGPVSSVLLVGETEPEQWTKVVLDGVSRTSVVLARLLLTRGPLSQRVRPDLEIVQGAPNSALAQVKRTVGGLVIGDAARTLPARLTTRIDLGTEWREWTGLPFVFAVWAGRTDLPRDVIEHLADAGRRGVEGIRTSYVGDDLRYLTENLRYPLDDRALIGLRRFGALAHDAGLVPTADLELYAPAPVIPHADLDLLLSSALDRGALPIGDLATLLRFAPVADLAAAADLKRRELYPGDDVPVRLAVHLPSDADPATLRPAIAAGATRIVLDGAVDPARVRAIRAAFPGIELQGGGPGDDPRALAEAGVTVVAEVDELGPWWVWAESAARAGLRLEVAVVVGRDAGETEEDLAARLVRLRDLRGLAAVRVVAADGRGPYGTVANTATDHLRALSVARLCLPGTVRIVASPETEGLGVAQASLRSGADHGGVVTYGGEGWAPGLAALDHQITEVGLRPVHA
ncbi:MAG: MqnA/MqnD/SBP family protein [Myxococcota bacterium]